MAFTAERLLSMYAPTLGSSADAGDWLQLGRESLNSSLLGSQYEEAVALFAAHRMTLVTRFSAVAGAITSQSTGSVSQSYSTGTPRQGWEDYAQTNFGIRLQQILVSCGACFGVVDAGDLMSSSDTPSGSMPGLL